MKQKIKLNKYFLDPKNDDCGELFNQISILDKEIKKLRNNNQSRIPGIISKNTLIIWKNHQSL